ncbi:MAG: hypothetical protein KDC80_26075 [Saprospiraceae bacterium]|nr:hypothetical protein [Saprospiraceae bacterium]
MNIGEFKRSLKNSELPAGLTAELKALWYDGKGNWDYAHEIAQDIESRSGSHIHAYLHRKEGDLANAGYWYRRADRQMPNKSLEAEWEDLVEIFL